MGANLPDFGQAGGDDSLILGGKGNLENPGGGHDQAIGRILVKGGGKPAHFRNHRGADGANPDHGGGSGQGDPVFQFVLQYQPPLGDQQGSLPEADISQPGPLFGGNPSSTFLWLAGKRLSPSIHQIQMWVSRRGAAFSEGPRCRIPRSPTQRGHPGIFRGRPGLATACRAVPAPGGRPFCRVWRSQWPDRFFEPRRSKPNIWP